MIQLVYSPEFQCTVVPWVFAVAVAPLLAIKTEKIAILAIPAGFLAGSLVVNGLPEFPFVSSVERIPIAIAIGIALGFGNRTDSTWSSIIAVAWLLAVIGWIGWSKINSDPWTLLLLSGFALTIFQYAKKLTPRELARRIFLISGTLGAVTFMGGSASISQSAIAVASASLGVMIYNYPRDRWRRNAPLSLVCIVGTVILLFERASLYTESSQLALAITALITFIPFSSSDPRKIFRQQVRIPSFFALAALIGSALFFAYQTSLR